MRAAITLFLGLALLGFGVAGCGGGGDDGGNSGSGGGSSGGGGGDDG